VQNPNASSTCGCGSSFNYPSVDMVLRPLVLSAFHSILNRVCTRWRVSSSRVTSSMGHPAPVGNFSRVARRASPPDEPMYSGTIRAPAPAITEMVCR